VSIVSQIREQQSWEQPPKKSGSLGFILGTLAAFAGGIMLVMAWGALPSFLPGGGTAPAKPESAAQPGKAQAEKKVVIAASSARIGHAVESPLLRTCVPSRELGFEKTDRISNKDIYRILQMGAHASGLAGMIGVQQDAVDPVAFASLWGEVADCVFRQNGWALCQPDNRALAVEAVSTFVRQTAAASAPQRESDVSRTMAKVQGDRGRANAYALQNAHAIRERVFAALRMRVEEGRLIAADFGMFTPGAVLNVVKSARAREDACAAR